MKTHLGSIRERIGSLWSKPMDHKELAEYNMMSDKTLYLHIGCGKTGSSALQVWLNNQAEVLREHGVDYPTFGRDKLDTYAITSGNGKKLLDAVDKGEAAAFLEQLARSGCAKVFLSSESFQSFSEENLREIKAQAAQFGMRIGIIVYVRDVYDVVYSAYQQLIKRHLGTQTFREYGLKRERIQQFEVVAAYSRHFDDIRVLHYDTERGRGLEVSMLEALGVDPAKVPPMPTAKVNRSLDVHESELLRLANQKYVLNIPGGRNSFSGQISDALIYGDPEHETEILLDDVVMQHLEKLCRPALNALNSRYLSATPMSIFDPTGKKIVHELPAIPAIYGTAIDSIIKFMSAPGDAKRGGEPANHRPGRPAAARRGGGEAAAPDAVEPIACNDPRVANALRDEAIRIEKKDLPRALTLMTAAAALRPNGAAIKRKLEEYKALLH